MAPANWKGGMKRVGHQMFAYAPRHPARDPDGFVCEHRLVMEAALGRTLADDETVAHRNGNGLDNRLANLELRSERG